MKRLEHQFQRLLRAAARTQPASVGEPLKVPNARWLMRRRDQLAAQLPPSLRPVLQGGLAVACLLLLVASLVNLRQIERANQDVFAVSGEALTHLSMR